MISQQRERHDSQTPQADSLIRYDFDKIPSVAECRTRCAWFRWHTIDPSDVLIYGFVEIDKEARQIRYLTIARDREGKIICDPVDGAYEIIAVRQLESVPSDFPLR